METYEAEGDDKFWDVDLPLRVTDPEMRNDPLFAKVIEAAGQVGISHNPDYNGARQDGIAMSQATIFEGAPDEYGALLPDTDPAIVRTSTLSPKP